MTPSWATGYTPFFMVYGSKAILLTDLDYGVPRVRAYDEQGTKASLEDAMDQLDEARDVALLRLAKYQQALRRNHSRRVRGRAFNIGRPGPLPSPEQQGPPQARPTMGGTVRHRGGAPARRLQAKDHQR